LNSLCGSVKSWTSVCRLFRSQLRPVRSDVRPGQFQDSGSELPGSWNRGPADRKRAGSACHPGMLPPGGEHRSRFLCALRLLCTSNGATRMQRVWCFALNYLLARFPTLRIAHIFVTSCRPGRARLGPATTDLAKVRGLQSRAFAKVGPGLWPPVNSGAVRCGAGVTSPPVNNGHRSIHSILSVSRTQSTVAELLQRNCNSGIVAAESCTAGR
jgi:hypothetical protein